MRRPELVDDAGTERGETEEDRRVPCEEDAAEVRGREEEGEGAEPGGDPQSVVRAESRDEGRRDPGVEDRLVVGKLRVRHDRAGVVAVLDDVAARARVDEAVPDEREGSIREEDARAEKGEEDQDRDRRLQLQSASSRRR
jgi:hypothetical protein